MEAVYVGSSFLGHQNKPLPEFFWNPFNKVLISLFCLSIFLLSFFGFRDWVLGMGSAPTNYSEPYL